MPQHLKLIDTDSRVQSLGLCISSDTLVCPLRWIPKLLSSDRDQCAVYCRAVLALAATYRSIVVSTWSPC